MFLFVGARTRDEDVCLITERVRGGEITCVSEKEFVDRGTSAEVVNYVGVAD